MSITVRGKTILGPNIVTSGLTLYLDAANINSYPGTGTVWYDVSGNGYQANMSNLTSDNWVTYNGIKAFETSDVDSQGFRISNFPFPQSGRTYEIWLNSKSYAIGWQSWFDDNNTEKILFGTSTNSIFVYPDLNFSGNLVAGNWYQLIYTMTGVAGSNCVGYKNSESVGSGTYTQAMAVSGTLYILGDATSEVTSCYCPLVRIYNRPLSQTEVTQNYNAQKSRFGL